MPVAAQRVVRLLASGRYRRPPQVAVH
jgi:hypothetical protein